MCCYPIPVQHFFCCFFFSWWSLYIFFLMRVKNLKRSCFYFAQIILYCLCKTDRRINCAETNRNILLNQPKEKWTENIDGQTTASGKIADVTLLINRILGFISLYCINWQIDMKRVICRQRLRIQTHLIYNYLWENIQDSSQSKKTLQSKSIYHASMHQVCVFVCQSVLYLCLQGWESRVCWIIELNFHGLKVSEWGGNRAW